VQSIVGVEFNRSLTVSNGFAKITTLDVHCCPYVELFHRFDSLNIAGKASERSIEVSTVKGRTGMVYVMMVTSSVRKAIR
jgi:hypothetical protein